jgi:hypothetical protein
MAAARANVPAAYWQSAFARDRGLLSYGVELVDTFRRAATYVDRIPRTSEPVSGNPRHHRRGERNPLKRGALACSPNMPARCQSPFYRSARMRVIAGSPGLFHSGTSSRAPSSGLRNRKRMLSSCRLPFSG